MPFTLRNYKILYQPIPKVACTSIKHALYALDEGKPYKSYWDEKGNERHIHNWQGTDLFKSVKTRSDTFKFCVIRDPLKRLLSAYSNCVVYHDCLAPERLGRIKREALEVKPRPSLDEFFLNLEAYRVASFDVEHHTNSQVLFTGLNLSYYSKVYKISDLGQLAADLTSRVGQPVKFEHLQTGGPKIGVEELSNKALRVALNYCDVDYRVFSSLFPRTGNRTTRVWWRNGTGGIVDS